MIQQNSLLKDGETLDDLEYDNLKIIQSKFGYKFSNSVAILDNSTPSDAMYTISVCELCAKLPIKKASYPLTTLEKVIPLYRLILYCITYFLLFT